MSFGEKLTKLRKERNMSQEDLANTLNVSRQAVSKWESNSSYPETDKIVAICKIFNCSMDELIGLKEGNVKKGNKFISNFNKYFDLVIKGIKLFYSMTFKQKVKCLVEMMFYALMIIFIFLIINTFVIEIIRNLFYLLPNELLIILIQTFRGLLLLVYLVLGIYVLVKLYNVRYLKYYEEYNDHKEEVVIEEYNVSKINIKDEKIIIRDPNNAFQPFIWIKSSLLYFVKFITLFLVMALAIVFIILIACIIFILYFVNLGLLILYIALGLLGALISIYVILEVFIKFIFNMKQSAKRLFVMFIIGIIIIGLFSGLFVYELTTYKIIDEPIYDTLIYEEEINMQDNLLINFLYYKNSDIIFEERDNIKIQFYSSSRSSVSVEIQNDSIICENSFGSVETYYESYMYYNYPDYFNDKTFNDFLRNILQSVKEKEIVTEDVLFKVVPKIYISKENYQKILSYHQKYEKNTNSYWCTYE
ncbi:MAG: helix-turn-helix transcriptional regulator [Firmicutes bacterium]|nr:helix-turn-helix transcriptional regulator [Bacillota bacterium]